MPPIRRRAASRSTSAARAWCSARARRHSCSKKSLARARAARRSALLTAYGNSCDAAHMSRPDRDGQVRAMREALIEAGLEPSAIGYINAHGTATAVGDVVEAEAINVVFGAAARDVPVSSTKSLHGH